MEVISRHHLVATLGFPQVRVNDGEWHHLLVELKSVKEGKDIKYIAAVSLDYDMYQVLSAASHLKDNLRFGQVFNKNSLHLYFKQKSVEIGYDLPGLKLQTLYVGGLPAADNHVSKGFVGCIQVDVCVFVCVRVLNLLCLLFLNNYSSSPGCPYGWDVDQCGQREDGPGFKDPRGKWLRRGRPVRLQHLPGEQPL